MFALYTLNRYDESIKCFDNALEINLLIQKLKNIRIITQKKVLDHGNNIAFKISFFGSVIFYCILQLRLHNMSMNFKKDLLTSNRC